MTQLKKELNKGINVLSLFDGMSCGQIALKELGIKVDNYYAAEIDKYAIQQTQHNFPNTIQLGSVTDIKATDLPKIDLLIGGSPCQGFSFAGKQLNFNDPRSVLFFEFVRLWKEIKAINPEAKFLLENVNMKKEYLRVISEYLGIFPVNINSNLVSAQNRNRWYWTNIKTKDVGLFDELWSDIPQPEDRGILLKDILQPESEVDKKYYLSNSVTVNLLKHKENQKLKGNGFGVKLHKGNDKFNALKVGGSGVDDIYCVAMRGRNPSKSNDRRTGSPTQQRLEPKTDGKTNCLTSVTKDNLISIGYLLRRLTPRECGKLQTFTDKELDVLLNAGISDTQLYKQFGNGWTIEAIAHIISFWKL
jgi:DNA (cytosine-5)-methyltransferase 3A